MTFRARHLLGVEQLSPPEITTLLDLAESYVALNRRTVKHGDALEGLTQINLFFENSTRTQSSFELAGKRLGADVMNMAVAQSSVKKGETLIDTAMTLNSMRADAIVIRHASSGAVQLIADKVDCPVLNAGDGTHQHPTQALLDALTIRRRRGSIAGQRVVICGDVLHSRVARSNAVLLSTLGAEVVLVAPRTLLPVGVETWPVTVADSLDAELPGADAVMMLRVQAERMNGGFFPSHREYANLFGLSKDRAAAMHKDAIVMHPGPMLRGMEINYGVADLDNTAVLQQVHNGVHARMAVLFTLLTNGENAGI